MKTRARILITTDAVGGVWQYSTELAAGLVAQGHAVALALLGPSPDPERLAGATALGIELHSLEEALDWLADGPSPVLAAGRRVAQLADQWGADIVQLNQPSLGTAQFDCPTIAVAHSCVATWWQAVRDGPMPADFLWRTQMMAEGLARADRVVAPSASFADQIARTYGLTRRPTVVHNGRTPVSCPSAAMHDFAFTAGRLWDDGKNARTLDRVAARLGIPFKAAGPLQSPAGERVELQHLMTLGAVGDEVMTGCMAPRPIFVSAARYEPFGLAVLEAATAGCPLILSDIPTFHELWDGCANFVSPDDVDGFVAAIEEMVGDVALRVQMGARASRRAASYSAEKLCQRMLGLYGELVPAGRTYSQVTA